MNRFPCLVRSSSPSGETRYALGDPLVDGYLASCRSSDEQRGDELSPGSLRGRSPPLTGRRPTPINSEHLLVGGYVPGRVTLTDDERAALHARYRQERDKRLRPDGVDQYLAPTGRFARLEEDPYTPRTEREPRTDHTTFAFLGGGFAGLCVAARLSEAGLHDVRIIEAGGDFGGVWYWNRYPGAMCDTASLVYLPLLEETGYRPTMKYVPGREIREHAVRIAEHYDLYRNAVFSTKVTRLTWDDVACHWIIETDRGDRMTAKYVATGTGPLNRPKFPGIEGIDAFAGHSFHTSRWDYAYTGGSDDGSPMTGLADKRVGVIGTGATAIQCVPPLARDAMELFVFQRTPSAIGERNNQPIKPAWYATLQPGWQKEWLLNFATLQSGGFADEDLVHDGWTDIAQRIRDRMVENLDGSGEITPEAFLKAYQDSDDERMEEIRHRVDALVRDRATAQSLRAWYRQFCKRPCFHDEYLQSFNAQSVHLVDTDGKGVDRLDETGAWANGTHYDLDCIVYASGFEFNTDYTRRSGFEIIGQDGVKLSDRWSDGMQTFQGMHVRGFPNLFIVGFAQAANLAANVTSNYTEAGITVAAVVRHAEDIGARRVETSIDAEQAWVAAIEAAPDSFVGGPDCTPGYYNNEGRPEGRRHKLNMGGYPLGPVPFFEYIDQWRSSGSFDGLEFN